MTSPSIQRLAPLSIESSLSPLEDRSGQRYTFNFPCTILIDAIKAPGAQSLQINNEPALSPPGPSFFFAVCRAFPPGPFSVTVLGKGFGDQQPVSLLAIREDQNPVPSASLALLRLAGAAVGEAKALAFKLAGLSLCAGRRLTQAVEIFRNAEACVLEGGGARGLAEAAQLELLAAEAASRHGQLRSKVAALERAAAFHVGRVPAADGGAALVGAPSQQIDNPADVASLLQGALLPLVSLLVSCLPREAPAGPAPYVRDAAARNLEFLIEHLGGGVADLLPEIVTAALAGFPRDGEPPALARSFVRLVDACVSALPHLSSGALYRLLEEALAPMFAAGRLPAPAEVEPHVIQMVAFIVHRAHGDVDVPEGFLQRLQDLLAHESPALRFVADKAWAILCSRSLSRVSARCVTATVAWITSSVEALGNATHEALPEGAEGKLRRLVEATAALAAHEHHRLELVGALPVLLALSTKKLYRLETLPLFEAVWRCIALVDASLPEGYGVAVNDVIVPILRQAVEHARLSSPPVAVLTLLGVLLSSDRKPDSALTRELLAFLAAFCPWIPHSVHDETFDLFTRLVWLLRDALGPAELDAITRALLDRYTVKSMIQAQSKRLVIAIIMGSSTGIPATTPATPPTTSQTQTQTPTQTQTHPLLAMGTTDQTRSEQYLEALVGLWMKPETPLGAEQLAFFHGCLHLAGPGHMPVLLQSCRAITDTARACVAATKDSEARGIAVDMIRDLTSALWHHYQSASASRQHLGFCTFRFFQAALVISHDPSVQLSTLAAVESFFASVMAPAAADLDPEAALRHDDQRMRFALDMWEGIMALTESPWKRLRRAALRALVVVAKFERPVDRSNLRRFASTLRSSATILAAGRAWDARLTAVRLLSDFAATNSTLLPVLDPEDSPHEDPLVATLKRLGASDAVGVIRSLATSLVSSLPPEARPRPARLSPKPEPAPVDLVAARLEALPGIVKFSRVPHSGSTVEIAAKALVASELKAVLSTLELPPSNEKSALQHEQQQQQNQQQKQQQQQQQQPGGPPDPELLFLERGAGEHEDTPAVTLLEVEDRDLYLLDPFDDTYPQHACSDSGSSSDLFSSRTSTPVDHSTGASSSSFSSSAAAIYPVADELNDDDLGIIDIEGDGDWLDDLDEAEEQIKNTNVSNRPSSNRPASRSVRRPGPKSAPLRRAEIIDARALAGSSAERVVYQRPASSGLRRLGPQHLQQQQNFTQARGRQKEGPQHAQNPYQQQRQQQQRGGGGGGESRRSRLLGGVRGRRSEDDDMYPALDASDSSDYSDDFNAIFRHGTPTPWRSQSREQEWIADTGAFPSPADQDVERYSFKEVDAEDSSQGHSARGSSSNGDMDADHTASISPLTSTFSPPGHGSSSAAPMGTARVHLGSEEDEEVDDILDLDDHDREPTAAATSITATTAAATSDLHSDSDLSSSSNSITTATINDHDDDNDDAGGGGLRPRAVVGWSSPVSSQPQAKQARPRPGAARPRPTANWKRKGEPYPIETSSSDGEAEYLYVEGAVDVLANLGEDASHLPNGLIFAERTPQPQRTLQQPAQQQALPPRAQPIRHPDLERPKSAGAHLASPDLHSRSVKLPTSAPRSRTQPHIHPAVQALPSRAEEQNQAAPQHHNHHNHHHATARAAPRTLKEQQQQRLTTEQEISIPPAGVHRSPAKIPPNPRPMPKL